MATLISHHNDIATPRQRTGVTCVQLNEDLWRITRPDGDVLGYVERFADPRGQRFRAKRLNMLKRHFIVLGEFWSIDDAIGCLHFG